MAREGRIRRWIKSRIDNMSTEIAVDLLSTRSNRYSSFDFMNEYCDSWIGCEVRWDEQEYAEVVAGHKLGLNEQVRVYADWETGEVSIGTVPFRHTKRFPYLTTDENGNQVIRQAHL